MKVPFSPEVHCSGIFDRLERFTPEQRAYLFYRLEHRWCWDCGRDQAECLGHFAPPNVPKQPAAPSQEEG